MCHKNRPHLPSPDPWLPSPPLLAGLSTCPVTNGHKRHKVGNLLLFWSLGIDWTGGIPAMNWFQFHQLDMHKNCSCGLSGSGLPISSISAVFLCTNASSLLAWRCPVSISLSPSLSLNVTRWINPCKFVLNMQMYGWVCLMPSDYLFGRSVSVGLHLLLLQGPLPRNCTPKKLHFFCTLSLFLWTYTHLHLLCTYFALTLHSFCTCCTLSFYKRDLQEDQNWEILMGDFAIGRKWHLQHVKCEQDQKSLSDPHRQLFEVGVPWKKHCSNPSWLTNLLSWNHLHHRSTSFRFSVLVVVIITPGTFQEQDSALMTTIDRPCHSCHLW